MLDDMSLARREAAIALVRLAASADVQERADAGRGLASFADLPDARAALVLLVLDAMDTYVTLETSLALLRRHDQLGLEVLAEAVPDADDSQADWIFDAVHMVLSVYADERDAAVNRCRQLLESESAEVRAGAADLVLRLSEINPVLWPTSGRGAEPPAL